MRLHPRLSLNALCSFSQTFEQDLALWDDLGLTCVGLFFGKLEVAGYQTAVNALRSRNIKLSCIISGVFDLTRPETWDKSRDVIARCIETAAILGGCVYGPPGRAGIGAWDRQIDTYAKAIAPSLAMARSCGVKLAFEPTNHPTLSFVNNLSDSIDVMDRTGVDVVVDTGNCWSERDVETTIRGLGQRIALVQMGDFVTTNLMTPGFEKVLPGEGDLPLARLVQATLDAGYQGPFEVETMDADKNPGPAIRAAVAHTNTLLERLLPS